MPVEGCGRTAAGRHTSAKSVQLLDGSAGRQPRMLLSYSAGGAQLWRYSLPIRMRRAESNRGPRDYETGRGRRGTSRLTRVFRISARVSMQSTCPAGVARLLIQQPPVAVARRVRPIHL